MSGNGNRGRGRGGGRGRGRGGGGGRGRGARGRGRFGSTSAGRGRGRGRTRQPPKDNQLVGKSFKVSSNVFRLTGEVNEPKFFGVSRLAEVAEEDSKQQSGGDEEFSKSEYKAYTSRLTPDMLRAELVKLGLRDNDFSINNNEVYVHDSQSRDLSAVSGLVPAETGAEGSTMPRLETINVLHHVWESDPKYQRSGNFVFKRTAEKGSASQAVDIREGHRQSVLGESCTSTTTASFVAFKSVACPLTTDCSVLEFLDFQRLIDHRTGHWDQLGASDALRGTRVYAKSDKYKINFTCDGVQSGKPTQYGAKNTVFKLDDGSRTSVFDYFKKQYGITLKHPDFPLLWRRARKRTVFVPAELLRIVPGRIKLSYTSPDILKRSTFGPAKMIENAKATAKETDDRVARCVSAGDLFLSASSLRVDREPVLCDATLLKTPQIAMKLNGSKEEICASEQWDWRGKKAIFPTQISKIGIVDCSLDGEAGRNCVDSLLAEMSNHGMGRAQAVKINSTNQNDTDAMVREAVSKKVSACFIFLQRTDSRSYLKVKRSFDDAGMPSQCVAKWRRRLDPQHARNLVLKLNCKVGGVNVTPRSLDTKLHKQTLFVGIDVYHGGAVMKQGASDAASTVSGGSGTTSSSEQRKPSLLAVVGHWGDKFEKVATSLQAVKGGQEVCLQGFAEVFKRVVDVYVADTGRKPSKLIVYRDAVGDSSREAMHACEIVNGVRAVCPKKETLLTWVVVTKRHDVRFAVERAGAGMTNLDSGTVVRDAPFVTPHPLISSTFFLQSYKARNGDLTARATRYDVFENDGRLSQSAIYSMTYALTFTRQRACCATAIPSILFAADAAAFRARTYVEDSQFLGRLDSNTTKKLAQWWM